MDGGFLLALGVALMTPALQYLFPTLPTPLAWSGVVLGCLIALSEFLPSNLKPPLSAVALFVAAAFCLGGSVHLYLRHIGATKIETKLQDPPATSTAVSEPTVISSSSDQRETAGTPDPTPSRGRTETDGHLRARALVLTRQIRAFENGYEQNRTRLTDEKWDRQMKARTGEADPKIAFERQTNIHRDFSRQEDELRNNVQTEFMDRFYADALSVRNELRARLGLFAPFAPDIRLGLLDKKLFAGIRPMTGEADYIEELARRLPE